MLVQESQKEQKVNILYIEMRKKVGIIKRNIAIFLIIAMSINSFGAIVSDNDGSAFITKSEFDALKSSFQSQIDTYNQSIDSKIDGAIASYLAGIKLASEIPLETPYDSNRFKFFAGDFVTLFPTITLNASVAKFKSPGSMSEQGFWGGNVSFQGGVDDTNDGCYFIGKNFISAGETFLKLDNQRGNTVISGSFYNISKVNSSTAANSRLARDSAEGKPSWSFGTIAGNSPNVDHDVVWLQDDMHSMTFGAARNSLPLKLHAMKSEAFIDITNEGFGAEHPMDVYNFARYNIDNEVITDNNNAFDLGSWSAGAWTVSGLNTTKIYPLVQNKSAKCFCIDPNLTITRWYSDKLDERVVVQQPVWIADMYLDSLAYNKTATVSVPLNKHAYGIITATPSFIPPQNLLKRWNSHDKTGSATSYNNYSKPFFAVPESGYLAADKVIQNLETGVIENFCVANGLLLSEVAETSRLKIKVDVLSTDTSGCTMAASKTIFESGTTSPNYLSVNGVAGPISIPNGVTELNIVTIKGEPCIINFKSLDNKDITVTLLESFWIKDD